MPVSTSGIELKKTASLCQSRYRKMRLSPRRVNMIPPLGSSFCVETHNVYLVFSARCKKMEEKVNSQSNSKINKPSN